MNIHKIVKNDYRNLLLYGILYNIFRMIFMAIAMDLFITTICFIATNFDYQIKIVFNIYFYILILLIFCAYVLYLPLFFVKLFNFNKMINNIVSLKLMLVSSQLIHVYYLSILKANNALTNEEFDMKKNHLLGKRYFSAENFYLLAKYKNYLEISDQDFEKKKQMFLDRNEKISLFDLQRLIKIGAINIEEARKMKLDYTHYYLIFIILYLITGLFIALW